MESPQDVAQRWAQNLGRATAKIQAKVNAVKVAPTAVAAQRLDKYLAKTQEAVTSGRMAQALNGSSLQYWQQQMLGKGMQRLSGGATAAVPKMTQFLTGWLPEMESLKARIASMPKNTIEDSVARAAEAIRNNAGLKGRYKVK